MVQGFNFSFLLFSYEVFLQTFPSLLAFLPLTLSPIQPILIKTWLKLFHAWNQVLKCSNTLLVIIYLTITSPVSWIQFLNQSSTFSYNIVIPFY